MEQHNLTSVPVLPTERLLLRELLPNDVQNLFLLRSDPNINKYLDRQPSRTQEEVLKFMETIRRNSQSYWAIAEKGHEKLIGTIGLFNIITERRTCEIGFELLTDYQGRGFMKEAANKVTDYAFNTLGTRFIEALVHQDNQRSIFLLQSLKFVRAINSNQENPALLLFQRQK